MTELLFKNKESKELNQIKKTVVKNEIILAKRNEAAALAEDNKRKK